MNILFLTLNVSSDNKRDAIVYNFIWKEMDCLLKRNNNMFCFSNLDSHKSINKIFFISTDALLEKNKWFRRFKNLVFALKNINFFYPLIKLDLKKTMRVCGIERACIKAINKYKIDIVHTHFFTPNGEAATLSTKKCAIPLVATIRGAELENMPEIDYGACREKFYRTALQKSIEHIGFFTAPNKYLCEKLKKNFNVPEEKVRYVPNGIEKISYTRNKSELDNDFIFISICSFIKRKNLDALFQTIPNLARKMTFKVYVVGDGPLKNKCVNFCNSKNLQNVVFFDPIPKDQLFQLISECDCLINPSFFEGMPNVVLESLAIGIPCLVSDIPGHQEIIREGFNGFFFDPNKKDDIGEKMEFILKNRHALESMKSDCIGSVNQYSIDAKIDQYLELYNLLYKNRR